MVRQALGALYSLYNWRYPDVLTYMLQASEYQAGPYLRWFWRTQHFGRVMYRRELDATRPARWLRGSLRLGMALQAIGAAAWLVWPPLNQLPRDWPFAAALLVSYPVVWAHVAVVPLEIGRWLIVRPRQQRQLRQARQQFAAFEGPKIAVAGSYGKTTMKELLAAVLGEGLRVAATPANRNVASSHAAFIRRLRGDEAVLIIEFGEGAPGDVPRFTELTQPTHAVITGLAPAHLDRYKTLAAAGADIFSLAQAVPAGQAYVNTESAETAAFMRDDYHSFDRQSVLGWRVRRAAVTIDGLRFDMVKGKQTLAVRSPLLGRHQIGPLALSIALALELGVSERQALRGAARARAFEHRMQPYKLNGAWIIDDTYNGNIEGVKAGTELLRELPAKRKVYVTPGLVDQGAAAQAVHERVGGLIAAAAPDTVVLMRNSTTAAIRHGLEAHGFQGEVITEQEPLRYYTNLKEVVAAGDLVLLQNDWTDNYA